MKKKCIQKKNGGQDTFSIMRLLTRFNAYCWPAKLHHPTITIFENHASIDSVNLWYTVNLEHLGTS
jgi:hypothetical protein